MAENKTGVEYKDLMPGAKRIIAVASGKGGVGKSTVAANLAVALSKLGNRTGLFDADIYGPSITKMFGTGTKDIKVIDQKIEPVIAHGVHTISIGNLVDPDSATIWRGPLIHKALTQMLTDVNWGELDYLIVDLPPGTGDVQISLAQLMKITGFIAVSTPQEMSLADVVKAADMFKKVDVPLLGIVENMSYFICDSCNKKHFIFGKSKVSSYADKVNAGFFYQIPIEKSIMDSGESGEPYAIKDENDIYGELSSKLEKTVDKK